MKEIVTYDGKQVEYVIVKFEGMTFWQRICFCWGILTKEWTGIRTPDVEIKERIIK